MKQNQAQQDRIDRAIKEVQEKHPGVAAAKTPGGVPVVGGAIPDEWIEHYFYGSELHLYVWDRAQGKTIAHYTDVVDDLEHALTAPQNARQR